MAKVVNRKARVSKYELKTQFEENSKRPQQKGGMRPIQLQNHVDNKIIGSDILNLENFLNVALFHHHCNDCNDDEIRPH